MCTKRNQFQRGRGQKRKQLKNSLIPVILFIQWKVYTCLFKSRWTHVRVINKVGQYLWKIHEKMGYTMDQLYIKEGVSKNHKIESSFRKKITCYSLHNFSSFSFKKKKVKKIKNK